MIAGAAPSVFSDDFEMKKFAEFFQNFYKASTYANLFSTGLRSLSVSKREIPTE